MPTGGFGSDDVINRRVNRHIKSLLPETVSDLKDYHFEGQRVLGPDLTPGAASECLYYLEAYVGQNGQFDVRTQRRFDPETDGEWSCRNRIARSQSAGIGSLDPFEYRVRTVLEIAGRTKRDRSRVSWQALGADPIYGGREAQAAVLLAEKMAHRKASETGDAWDHCGSLGHLGSLSDVIDNSRHLRVEWEDVDALLGPDADTIAASAGFDRLESDDRRRRAEQKGVDFLSESLEQDLGQFEGRVEPTGSSEADDESWRTLPSDVDPDEAEREIERMRDRVRALRNDPRNIDG